MEQNVDGLRRPKDPVPKEILLFAPTIGVDYCILNLSYDFRLCIANTGVQFVV